MAGMQYGQSMKQEMKPRLSMQMWLPLLQSGSESLYSEVLRIAEDNPCVEIDQKMDRPGRSFHFSRSEAPDTDRLEDRKASLYEDLREQINGHLFPTERSQEIAFAIIDEIDEEGYFLGSLDEIALRCRVTPEMVEKVRQRFAYLEPSGVGAVDMKESFLFQLEDADLPGDVDAFARKVIRDLDNMHAYAKHPHFNEALAAIKKMKTPPALEYREEGMKIVPDLVVEQGDDGMTVKINDLYYPDVEIKKDVEKDGYTREKLKEAREIVGLLALRKNTLYKLGMYLIEKQLSFFAGGDMSPLTMQEAADALGFNQSTISRAVAGKYIASERGVLPMKAFFCGAVTGEVSSDEVKTFIKGVVENESHIKPMSDQAILNLVLQRFRVKMVRRSVTKYRMELGIPSSTERKRYYSMVSA